MSKPKGPPLTQEQKQDEKAEMSLSMELLHAMIIEQGEDIKNLDARIGHYETHAQSLQVTLGLVEPDKHFKLRPLFWTTKTDPANGYVHSMAETIFGPLIVESGANGVSMTWLFHSPTNHGTVPTLDLENGHKLAEIKYYERLSPALASD